MRIAVVSNRAAAADAIRRALATTSEHQIAWVARDGNDAARRFTTEPPDLVLFDLPAVWDGGAESARWVAAAPCPVLVVTATVSGNFGPVYAALAAGAVDAVNAPVVGADGAVHGGGELLAKIAAAGRKARTGPATPWHTPVPARSPTPWDGRAAQASPLLVAVGASTGGPQAVPALLAQVPPSTPVAVLLVQHISAELAGGLAESVCHQSGFPARVARAGDVPLPGLVLVAGSDDHLILRPDGTLTYTPHPRQTPYRPSVDALFGSLAAHWPRPGVGVVLTGMGRDGAEGLLRLRQAGWATFAQDEASSVVYGMPAAAARLGAAAHVLPPDQIGRMILALALARRPTPQPGPAPNGPP